VQPGPHTVVTGIRKAKLLTGCYFSYFNKLTKRGQGDYWKAWAPFVDTFRYCDTDLAQLRNAENQSIWRGQLCADGF
jgi:hypothetical protein